jgi:hypothetical protein
MSRPRSWTQASAWAANASFSSITSMSFAASPARVSAFRVAGTGPMPITSASQPATATERIRARIVRPWAFAYASDVTSTADAPSVRGEEVPAVTVPSASKAGFRPDSASWLVSGRMVPSRVTPAIGTISAVSRPSACAAAALRWLSTAICCWSARVIW